MVIRIRKQVHELTPSDFAAHPCWEYAANEEGRENQDECTVRPLRVAALTKATHQVLVLASFSFPNGRTRRGMVTLNSGDDPSGHQPAVFLSKELLNFYVGATEPKASEVKHFVSRLVQVSESPFPVVYQSALRSSTGKPLATGALYGLYWWHNWPRGELRVEV